MVRRRFRPLLALAVVIAAAGSVTAAGLTFTAQTVSRTAVGLPEVKATLLPSYIVRMPEARTAELGAATAVEVKPRLEAAAPAAEVTPLSADTAPQPEGTDYVVRSDVFVRSGPSKNYAAVATIHGGTPVSVTEEQSGWLKVSFANGGGWVYQRYLAPAGTDVAEAETGSAPF